MANESDSPAHEVAQPLSPASDQCATKGLGFAVLCVQKAVEFNIKDHKLHRATKDKELHEELEKLTEVGPSTFLFQLGGGCRVVGTHSAGGAPLSSACVGDSVAAFQGTLSNLAELAEKYVPEPQAGPGQATPAEVICRMHMEVGVELLTKLRGRFAFCMYESKQGRVLAARDGSGAVHLYQGHSPNAGLVVSSTRAFLDTCSDLKAFAPGDFKYGWHSEPRQFSPIEFSHSGRQSNREGGRRGSLDHIGERHSIDRSNMNPSDRRGSTDKHGSIDRPSPPPHHSREYGAWKAAGADNESSNGSAHSGSGYSKGNRRSMEAGRNARGSMEGKYRPPSGPHKNLSVTSDQLKKLSVNAPEFSPSAMDI